MLTCDNVRTSLIIVAGTRDPDREFDKINSAVREAKDDAESTSVGCCSSKSSGNRARAVTCATGLSGLHEFGVSVGPVAPAARACHRLTFLCEFFSRRGDLALIMSCCWNCCCGKFLMLFKSTIYKN